jgi:NAD(P)-dependent dehydrogenase (short-subunit alcohol dehydrogenase family)
MGSVPRRVVVTGASRGLGQALACAFTGRGHHLEGCSRSGSEQSAFRMARVDISRRDDVQRWADALIGEGYVPDILIANAGLINEPAPLWRVPPEETERVLATNVLGTCNTLQAFLPSMLDRGRGVIVAMSSGWGRTTDPEFALYCASKFALEGLIGSLSQELPSGYAAVTLNPGIVRTDMLMRCWGSRALYHEPPDAWARRAAPFILGISADQNGMQLSVPSPEAVARCAG